MMHNTISLLDAKAVAARHAAGEGINVNVWAFYPLSVTENTTYYVRTDKERFDLTPMPQGVQLLYTFAPNGQIYGFRG